MLVSAPAVGVVEVQRETLDRHVARHTFDHASRRRRRPGPDRVAERHLVAPYVGKGAGHVGYDARQNLTFERTASAQETYPRTLMPCASANAVTAASRSRLSPIVQFDVALRERLGSRCEDCYFLHRAGSCGRKPLEVSAPATG